MGTEVAPSSTVSYSIFKLGVDEAHGFRFANKIAKPLVDVIHVYLL